MEIKSPEPYHNSDQSDWLKYRNFVVNTVHLYV